MSNFPSLTLYNRSGANLKDIGLPEPFITSFLFYFICRLVLIFGPSLINHGNCRLLHVSHLFLATYTSRTTLSPSADTINGIQTVTKSRLPVTRLTSGSATSWLSRLNASPSISHKHTPPQSASNTLYECLPMLDEKFCHGTLSQPLCMYHQYDKIGNG